MSYSSIITNSAQNLAGKPLTTTKQNAALDADTFLKLFTTQISNQDPMSPMETSDFLNQFSQISQVQMMNELQKSFNDFKTTLGSLNSSSEQAQAASMLGRTIEFIDGNNQTQSGKVDAVSISTSGDTNLLVNGTIVPMDKVRRITEPPAAAQPAA
jgi:flagellar basal-body rod modification protein FlgD